MATVVVNVGLPRQSYQIQCCALYPQVFMWVQCHCLTECDKPIPGPIDRVG